MYMKIKISFFLLFFFLFFYSQKMKTIDVLTSSDGILSNEVGKDLFKSFTISEGSYYRYQKNGKYTATAKFLGKKKLHKNVLEIWILYHFQNEKLGNARNGIWVKLDKNLNLIEPLNIKFIPDFLKNNQPSNFISNENAENIINSLKQNGLEISKPVLSFNEKSEKYVYYSINKLTKVKNGIGQDAGSTEIITIDALDGKLLSIENGVYGLIIR